MSLLMYRLPPRPWGRRRPASRYVDEHRGLPERQVLLVLEEERPLLDGVAVPGIRPHLGPALGARADLRIDGVEEPHVVGASKDRRGEQRLPAIYHRGATLLVSRFAIQPHAPVVAG